MNKVQYKKGDYIMQGMKIDFITNSIIVTKTFYEAANEYGSEEYTTLTLAQQDHPNMRVIVRTVRTGNRKNDSKGLTYKYMRRFIDVMDTSNLAVFNKVMLYYESLDYSNAEVYQCMKSWFLEQYPDHRDMIASAEPKRNILKVA